MIALLIGTEHEVAVPVILLPVLALSFIREFFGHSVVVRVSPAPASNRVLLPNLKGLFGLPWGQIQLIRLIVVDIKLHSLNRMVLLQNHLAIFLVLFSLTLLSLYLL